MAGWDWNQLLQKGESVLRSARGVIDAAMPQCELCHEPAYIPVPCIFCGRVVCLEHGWFHRRAFTICCVCLDRAFEQLSHQNWPFNVFGLETPCSELQVTKRFRQIAAVLVEGSGNIKLPWLWNLVQQARTDAINIIRTAEGDHHG